jgi:hypothetical protein
LVLSLTARLPGGLGNQLFALSAGLLWSKQLGTPLMVDLSQADHKHGSGNVKNLIESRLEPEGVKWKSNSVISKSLVRAEARLRLLNLSFISNYLPVYINDESIANLESFLENQLKCNVKHDRGSTARWISEGYFQDFSFYNLLKVKFIPNLDKLILGNSISEKQTNLYGNLSNLCCIHIRLGDYYTSLKKSLGVLNVDYYLRCMELSLKENPETVFHIYSNDIALARLLYSDFNDFDVIWIEEYKYRSRDPHSLLTFRRMTQYDRYILSNSTFSFWAAKLSNTRKTVFHPQPMFLDSQSQGVRNVPENWKAVPPLFIV